MKRFILILLVLGLAVSLFAQEEFLPEHYYATGSGNWMFIGNRLYQTDARSGLAKMNLRAPQSGPMIYEFNVRYEDGVQDGHGGFGIHLFANNVNNIASWGSGSSYLLWLNYDENPVTRGFPRGFTAQVYRSFNNSTMDLVDSFDLNDYLFFLTYENWAARSVPVKIWADGDSGEVRIYDPTDPDLYLYFYLPERNLTGDWVSLRTNGLRLSFGQ